MTKGGWRKGAELHPVTRNMQKIGPRLGGLASGQTTVQVGDCGKPGTGCAVVPSVGELWLPAKVLLS